MKHNVIINLLLSVLLFSFTGLNAQSVSYNEEFQANTYTTSHQRYSAVATLEDSGFVVCWQSNGQDGGVFGVYGQVFDKDGTRRGSEFPVNQFTTYNQQTPKVSGLIDGDFVVCWVSEGQDGSSQSIHARLFDKDGNALGSEFLVNTTTANEQNYADVSALQDSGFVVCWTSYESGGNSYEIYAQVFENNGNKRGSEFTVNTENTDDQVWSRVCGLADSGFVICWESYGSQDGDDSGVFAQIFENNASTRGAEFQVNTYYTSTQYEPEISALEDGGFIVTWTSYNQDGSSNGIYAQLFEDDGSKRDSEFRVNTYTTSDQSWSSVAGLADSGFAVCWQSLNQDGSSYGVYSQLYNSNGEKKGTEFIVNDYVSNAQRFPTISALKDGGLTVTWTTNGQDGDGDGVYAKYYLNELSDPLQTFALLSPANLTSLDFASVEFTWESANALPVNYPWEIEYKLYIDLNSGFTNPDIYSGIYDSTYTVDVLLPDTDYYWKVVAKNIDGDSLWSSADFMFHLNADPSSIVDGNDHVLNAFKLYGNYPNPFNPNTTIKYTLPADKSSYTVTVKIYDVLGQLVRILVNKSQAPGIYHLKWDGRNTSGNLIPSGVYICEVTADNFRAHQKMIMVK